MWSKFKWIFRLVFDFDLDGVSRGAQALGIASILGVLIVGAVGINMIVAATNDDSCAATSLAEIQSLCTNDFHNIGGTDDDIPESGDFGAGADLEADGSLSTNSVADNEINYGAVTLSDFTNDAGFLTSAATPTLAQLQDAATNDFHNIGGTDDDTPDNDAEVPDNITVNAQAGSTWDIANSITPESITGGNTLTAAEVLAITGSGTLTAEQVSDLVGAMVSGNTETNIAVIYQDDDNTLDFIVTGTTQTAHVFVVANNATTAEKAVTGAILCSGANDQVQLVQADAIANGREVIVSSGTFAISADLVIDQSDFIGMGMGNYTDKTYTQKMGNTEFRVATTAQIIVDQQARLQELTVNGQGVRTKDLIRTGQDGSEIKNVIDMLKNVAVFGSHQGSYCGVNVGAVADGAIESCVESCTFDGLLIGGFWRGFKAYANSGTGSYAWNNSNALTNSRLYYCNDAIVLDEDNYAQGVDYGGVNGWTFDNITIQANSGYNTDGIVLEGQRCYGHSFSNIKWWDFAANGNQKIDDDNYTGNPSTWYINRDSTLGIGEKVIYVNRETGLGDYTTLYAALTAMSESANDTYTIELTSNTTETQTLPAKSNVDVHGNGHRVNSTVPSTAVLVTGKTNSTWKDLELHRMGTGSGLGFNITGGTDDTFVLDNIRTYVDTGTDQAAYYVTGSDLTFRDCYGKGQGGSSGGAGFWITGDSDVYAVNCEGEGDDGSKWNDAGLLYSSTGNSRFEGGYFHTDSTGPVAAASFSHASGTVTCIAVEFGVGYAGRDPVRIGSEGGMDFIGCKFIGNSNANSDAVFVLGNAISDPNWSITGSILRASNYINVSGGTMNGVPVYDCILDGDRNNAMSLMDDNVDWNLDDDHTCTGKWIYMTVDENTQGFGNVFMMANDWHLEDADRSGTPTMAAYWIAGEPGTGANKVVYRSNCYCRDDSWNWSPNDKIYVGDDGDLTTAIPDGALEGVQPVAIPMSADIIWFNPDMTLVVNAP